MIIAYSVIKAAILSAVNSIKHIMPVLILVMCLFGYIVNATTRNSCERETVNIVQYEQVQDYFIRKLSCDGFVVQYNLDNKLSYDGIKHKRLWITDYM